MASPRRVKKRFSLLLFVVLIAATVVVAHDADSHTPSLDAAPPGASVPGAPAMGDSDDDGDISAPSTGTDAKSIIAASSHSMGTTADSTDDDDAKDPKSSNPSEHGGHHGQCVTGCATKSTAGVGCGNDLSKPDCFCKSENFIDQTFACINATCPQQFHGAAGVISSMCSASGAPGLKIPGYDNSSNLENMPTFTDGNKTNGTETGKSGGITSTFTMPVGMQTNIPSSNRPVSNGSDSTGASSGAMGGRSEIAGAIAVAVSVASAAASLGVWALL